VEVLMMFALPLLAISLAVPPKRSTSGLGIFLAILIVVAYHKVNQYGQQMGANGQINPILALWVPLGIFALMIAWMYHVLAHRPGGQPIGALERFFARIARLARSLMPRPRRAEVAQ
jgi:lipopolysaccharide export system permease protein